MPKPTESPPDLHVKLFGRVFEASATGPTAIIAVVFLALVLIGAHFFGQ